MFVAKLLELIRMNRIARVDSSELGQVSPVDLQAIFQALRTSTSVTTLNLSGMKLDEKCWRELANALEVNASITKIDLSNTGFTYELFAMLLQGLVNNVNLTLMPQIVSWGNPASFDSISPMLNKLVATTILKCTSSIPLNASTSTLKVLNLLAKNPAFTELDLSGHNLTLGHMWLVHQVLLTSCNNLRTLNLKGIVVVAENFDIVKELSLAIYRNEKLKVILDDKFPMSTFFNVVRQKGLLCELLIAIQNKDVRRVGLLAGGKQALLRCEASRWDRITLLFALCYSNDQNLFGCLIDLGNEFWNFPEIIGDRSGWREESDDLLLKVAIHLGDKAITRIMGFVGEQKVGIIEQLKIAADNQLPVMDLATKVRVLYVWLRLFLGGRTEKLLSIIAQQRWETNIVMGILTGPPHEEFV